jgi:hypothetical protein
MHRHEASPSELLSQEFPRAYRTAKTALGFAAVGACGVFVNSDLLMNVGFGFAGGLALLTPLVAYNEKQ